MPSRLSKNQFLDAKRVIKESKTRLSNGQIVKRAKLGSEKVVPMIRKARSYPHYVELVREKNRLAKQRRDARKNGQQSSLLAVDETVPAKKTEAKPPVQIKVTEPKHIENHESFIEDEDVKTDPVEAEAKRAEIRDNITRDQVQPITTETIVADLVRRVSSIERGQRSLFAAQSTQSKELNQMKEDILFTVPAQHKVVRKKFFGIF